MGDILRQTQMLSKTIVEWTIKNFFDTLRNPEDYRNSNIFLFHSLNWNLRFYFGTKESPAWISACVQLSSESDDDIPVGFSIGIKKADGSVFKSVEGEYTFNNKNTLMVERFLESSHLFKCKDVVFPDDTLTIFCTVNHLDNSEEPLRIPLPKSIETLSRNLTDLYLDGRGSDIGLKVRGREFQSHKSILSARSPVFDRLFQHDAVEAKSGTVDFADCESDTFQNFLLFLYGGEADLESCSSVVDLYKTADKFCVKELREACSMFLGRTLSVDTICDAVLLAMSHNEPKLLKKSTEYFIGNADKILLTEQWVEFSKDNHAFANELVIKAIVSLKSAIPEDNVTVELKRKENEQEDDEDY